MQELEGKVVARAGIEPATMQEEAALIAGLVFAE